MPVDPFSISVSRPLEASLEPTLKIFYALPTPEPYTIFAPSTRPPRSAPHSPLSLSSEPRRNALQPTR